MHQWRNLGVPIQTFGGLEGTRGVAFIHAGEIVVSAGGGVPVLTPNQAQIIIIWYTHGRSGPGQFQGVAVDDEGNIQWQILAINRRVQ